MATMKLRGNTHCVIYPYKENGRAKQQWESYETELQALQRESFIDYLQKNKKHDEIRQAAHAYKQERDQARGQREREHSQLQESCGLPSVAYPQKKIIGERRTASLWMFGFPSMQGKKVFSKHLRYLPEKSR